MTAFEAENLTLQKLIICIMYIPLVYMGIIYFVTCPIMVALEHLPHCRCNKL